MVERKAITIKESIPNPWVIIDESFLKTPQGQKTESKSFRNKTNMIMEALEQYGTVYVDTTRIPYPGKILQNRLKKVVDHEIGSYGKKTKLLRLINTDGFTVGFRVTLRKTA